MNAARPYAAAAFAHAKAENALDSWAKMFTTLAASESAIVSSVRAHPGAMEVIADAVSELLGLKDAGQINFLKVVAQNGRLEIVGEMARQFEDMHLDAQGAAVMRVESAHPMDKSARKSFDEFLCRWSGKEARAAYEENPDLLGGVRVYWRDNVLDASVRGRLERLAAALN